MLGLISSLIKYSLFAVVVLVLSHLVEFQGQTISKHVEKWMKVAQIYTPEKQAKLLSEEYKGALDARMKELNKLDADISPEDQQALKQVIERSENRR